MAYHRALGTQSFSALEDWDVGRARFAAADQPSQTVWDAAPTLDLALGAASLQARGGFDAESDAGLRHGCACCAKGVHRFTLLTEGLAGGETDFTIPGGVGTTATLSLGGSVVGVIDFAGDDDWYRVTLEAGQTYVFTLSGSGGTPLDDPYLELYNAAGSLIALDDDGGVGLGSMLRFTATTTGTYYINARPWEPDTGPDPSLVGQYTLSMNTGTPQDPLRTIDLGFALNSTNVTVYFAQAGETFQGNTASRGWTSNEIAAAFAAMATYSAVTNLSFTQVSSSASANWTLVLADLPDNTLGQFGGNASGGVGVFDPTVTSWTSAGLAAGGLAFVTLIHEFGHGLGLAHPHDNGGLGDNDSEVMQGVIDPFNSYGTFGLNQGVYTTMTYNDGFPLGTGFGQNAYGNQATPMALDIALLQQRYGADPNTNAGDTTYTLPQTNAAGTYYIAIWDVSGADSIVNPGSNDSTIDLRPATLLNASGGGGYVSYIANTRGGFTIANGVVIENATGGGGSDAIYGNDAANVLNGQAGNDTLIGGAGGDTLNGGVDADTASYQTATSGVTVDLVTPGSNTGDAAGDVFNSIEIITGSNFADTLMGNDATNQFVGGDGDDVIFGRGDSDSLSGGNGDDILNGGTGTDVLNGGAGRDAVSMAGSNAGVVVDLTSLITWDGSANDSLISIENIIGSSFNDNLWGDSGDNVINGGAGGSDNIAGFGGSDTVSYTLSTSGVIIDLGNQLTWDGAVNDALASIENALGSPFNDQIWGNSGDNIIDGGTGGADLLAGFGGFDTVSYANSSRGVIIDMGSGASWDGLVNDQLFAFHGAIGSAFDDDFRGTGGVDRIDGGAGADLLRGNDDADTFVMRAGQANGDTILDFNGQGAQAGDVLEFIGYGTAAQGASFTQIDATHWLIVSADGQIRETITLSNGATISPDDYIFTG